MVMYDWRRCPAQLTPPEGPADYGPLATDVGTRTFGEFEPMPDVSVDSCPTLFGGDMLTYLALGAGAWMLFKK